MASPDVAVGVVILSSNELVRGRCRLPRWHALAGSSSLNAAPVTGSLLFYAPVCCLADNCAAEVFSWVLFGGTDCCWLAVVCVDYFYGDLV